MKVATLADANSRLHTAVTNGQSQVAEQLLSKGADVNSVNEVSISIDYSIYIELCYYHCS